MCITRAGERFTHMQHEQTLLLAEKANFAAVLSFAIGRGTVYRGMQVNASNATTGPGCSFRIVAGWSATMVPGPTGS